MKDGRTHLAHKAEHAVDLETGAIVGVTVQRDDLSWRWHRRLYHSNQTLVDLSEAISVYRLLEGHTT